LASDRSYETNIATRIRQRHAGVSRHLRYCSWLIIHARGFSEQGYEFIGFQSRTMITEPDTCISQFFKHCWENLTRIGIVIRDCSLLSKISQFTSYSAPPVLQSFHPQPTTFRSSFSSLFIAPPLSITHQPRLSPERQTPQSSSPV
jgi:hypothetical protein